MARRPMCNFMTKRMEKMLAVEVPAKANVEVPESTYIPGRTGTARKTVPFRRTAGTQRLLFSDYWSDTI